MDTQSDDLDPFAFEAVEIPPTPPRAAKPFRPLQVAPNPRCRELYPEGFSFNVVRSTDYEN